MIGENWCYSYCFNFCIFNLDSICTCEQCAIIQVSLPDILKITEASARYFCGAKKLHTEPQHISAHLSIRKLQEAKGAEAAMLRWD